MTYVVEAYIDSRWTRLLATRNLAHAKAFKAEITGIRTRLVALAVRQK